MSPPAATPAIASCAGCVHFRNEPATLERLFPGLTALSSVRASVRASDGLCVLHGRYLSAWDACRHFERKPAAPDRG